eukprot:gene11708-4942_t
MFTTFLTPSFLLVAGIFAGILMAFSIGSNDVANAMGTALGAKATKLWVLIVLAALFETIGAVFLGGEVSVKIASQILNIEDSNVDQIDFMLLMVSTLFGSGAWLFVATIASLPVSTTHSIVGSLIGCGMLIGGPDLIHFDELLKIVISWVVSPLIGCLTTFLFWFVFGRLTVKSQNVVRNLRISFPIMTGLTACFVSLFLIYKGLKPLNLDVPIQIALPIALLLGTVAFALSAIIPIGLTHILKGIKKNDMVEIKETPKTSSVDSIEEDMDSKEMKKVHSKEEKNYFNFLVIATSCALAMAHGSNDIANAAGPLTAIVSLYEHGRLTGDYIFWVILLTSGGLLIGLISLGYKVMSTVGNGITPLTSARAFVVQFSTAFITLTFSGFGIPLSTTHIIVGAVIGISLADLKNFSDLKDLQWSMLGKIVMSWVITIPAAASVAMGFYAILKVIHV